MNEPGQIYRREIIITISGAVIVGIALLVLAYGILPSYRSLITFFGASVGISAAVINAFYRTKALKISIEQQERQLKESEIHRAFSFSQRWNDPRFSDLRARWRILMDEFKDMAAVDICNTLINDRDKRTVAVDILNFYEEMGCAAKCHVADIDTLEKIFKFVATRYFTVVYPWIEKRRTESTQPNLYIEIEWLVNLWRTHKKPTN